MPSWFDIVGLSADDQEDTDGTLSSAAYLASLVQKEISEGIPPERIVIAGFSQGGAVAMAAGLMMMDQPVAGIMCLSESCENFRPNTMFFRRKKMGKKNGRMSLTSRVPQSFRPCIVSSGQIM